MIDKVKEWLPVLLIAGVCAACVVACSGNEKMGNLNPAISSPFTLKCDQSTGVVYIENGVSGGFVYTPYYSKNGKLCRYEDGKLVEIEEDENDFIIATRFCERKGKMIDYVVSFPRGLRVNLNDIPDDFEDQIKDRFALYTQGTAKDYTYQDKLAFIDLIAQYVNKKLDSYTTIKNRILDECEYDLDNEGRLPDDEDFRSIEFMEECFEMGCTSGKLYTKVSGDHHIYDEVMKLEYRAIKAVMEWGENIETD